MTDTDFSTENLTDGEVKEFAGLLAACVKLRLAVPDLHDVEAALAEDGKTVLFIAPSGNHYATASFMLEKEMTEEEFDSHYYSSLFDGK